jgi:hypothetical protein
VLKTLIKIIYGEVLQNQNKKTVFFFNGQKNWTNTSQIESMHSQQAYKKCSAWLANSKTHIKTTVEHHYTPTGMIKIEKF